VSAPLVAVIAIVYVPVEAEAPAVSVSVEVAVPPKGGVTGLGRVKVTSAGAALCQDAAKPTCELKPSKAVT
jgi:hypothetical protein